MKLHRYILILSLLFNISQASCIKWYWDYEKALKIAKKENKSMMIVLRKNNCKDCQKLFEITFLNQPYIKKLNEKFISVVVAFEDKNSYPIEMFYTLEFPVIFFINPKDESFLKNPIFGFISPDKFLYQLN